MAKGSRGGKRVGGLTANQYIQQTATMLGITPQQVMNSDDYKNKFGNPQVDNTSTASNFSTDYNSFMAMTDDDKADVISNAISKGIPAHLSQSDFQKFVYNSGLNDKPDVVDDATLNKMNGTELWRTVNNVYDQQNDISYTADQIAKQVMAARVTRTSDSGGSAYGRGIYFADSQRESSYYGNTRGNVQKTAQIRCKLNSNANIIRYDKARSGVSSEISNGTKLGKVLQKCDRPSQASIYALAKGYNIIQDDRGVGYYNILNRNAVTMSKTISPI